MVVSSRNINIAISWSKVPIVSGKLVSIIYIWCNHYAYLPKPTPCVRISIVLGLVLLAGVHKVALML